MSTENAAEGKLDVTHLTVDEALRLLGVERSLIEEDIEEGAPLNADGTVNLVHYGAWLNTACERSEQTGSEPEGRVPKGCDAEGAHNLQLREGEDGT